MEMNDFLDGRGLRLCRSLHNTNYAVRGNFFRRQNASARMQTSLKTLRTLVGRVWRDIDRKLDWQDEVFTSLDSGLRQASVSDSR